MRNRFQDLIVPVGTNIYSILHGKTYTTDYDTCIDKAIDFLFTTFMPYVVIAKRESETEVVFNGIHFHITHVSASLKGLCKVSSIDEMQTRVRIPEAINVDGSYYLVTEMECYRENTSLKELILNNALQRISGKLSNFRVLERVICDDRGLFKMIDGILYEIDPETTEPNKVIWISTEYRKVETITLPITVEECERDAFIDCSYLRKLNATENFWKNNHFIFLDKDHTLFIFSDGNTYQILYKRDFYGDELYYHVALKRIGSNSEILRLRRPLPGSGINIQVDGIDLDESDEDVRVIELQNYSEYLGSDNSLPSNFIRNKSKLPNLSEIISTHINTRAESMNDTVGFNFKEGVNNHKRRIRITKYNDEIVPYLIRHDDIFYTILTEDTASTRRGYDLEGGNNTTGKLILPEKIVNDGKEYRMTDIDSFSFRESGLTEVCIPPSVRRIGEFAFAFCYDLKRVELSEGLKEIASSAFCMCENLTHISLPSTIEYIGEHVFAGVPLKHIVLPSSLKGIGDDAISCETVTLQMHFNPVLLHPRNISVSEYRVAPDNGTMQTVDGVLYDKEMKTLLAYPKNKTDSIFTIPDSIESIIDGFFLDNTYLKEIRIPASIKHIPRVGYGIKIVRY